MKHFPLIAQAEPPTRPQTVTTETPNSVTEWSVVIAAGIWIIRQAWELFAHKEKAEAELTRTLVDDLRRNEATLVVNNQEGFKNVVTAVSSQTAANQDGLQELRGAIVKMTQSIGSDVQTTLKSQSAIYAANTQLLSEIKTSLDAAHRRLDELFDTLTVQQDERKGRSDRREDDPKNKKEI